MGKVLVVDDDRATCNILQQVVEKIGHAASCCHTLHEAMRVLQQEVFDVVFLDVKMPDGSGLDYIEKVQKSPGSPEVIIITGAGTRDGADMAIRSGAWDYMQKPLSPKKILLPIKRVLEYRESLSQAGPRLLKRAGIVGSSRTLEMALERLALAAANDSNVLLLGETGTGKEVFARTLHENSNRASGRLVVVDCAALPENLVESALFGHVRGAFTGADRSTDGLVKMADGGTLFLDEVGELGLTMQKTLLRVLQEKTFRPVGATREQHSNFRLIAATNRDLAEMSAAGEFREDLLFRLSSHVIELPPLRKRPEDLEELVVHSIRVITERNGLKRKGYSPDFIEALQQHDWPGNIRELIHTVEQAVVKAQDTPIIFPQHLPRSLRIKIIDSQLKTAEPKEMPEQQVSANFSQILQQEEESLPTLRQFRETVIDSCEKHYLDRLMRLSGGEISKALSMADIGRTHLYNLLKKHNISR